MKTPSKILTVSSLALALASLSPEATAQGPNDVYWFLDCPRPAAEPFNMECCGNYLYVVGGFQSVGSVQDTKNIARWNLITENWEALPGMDTNPPSTFVRSVHKDSDGNLWVGGDFSSIGGVSANRIVRFNPATAQWSQLIDNTQSAAERTGPSSGGVYAIVRSGNYVYIGGFTFNGAANMTYIRRYNLTTSRWEAVGNGLNGPVRALGVEANGNVLAGGQFTASGGTTINHLARWNGSSWSAVAGGVNSNVREIVVNNGTIYAGGDFTAVGPSNTAAGYVACVTGTTWNTLGGGLAGGGSVAGIWEWTSTRKDVSTPEAIFRSSGPTDFR